MRTTLFQLLIAGALVLSACNLPEDNATPEVKPPTEQSTATIESTVTQTAAPTETPTVLPTETPIPEPSATATPEIVTAKVGRESNCRVGPGGIYKLVATYQDGQVLEVVARDLGGGYVFVRNPEKPEEQCYLLANNITISGDVSVLPKFTPLPSPTAVPYFNVSFNKFDTCSGDDFALFIVENAGSVPFRSSYIRMTDQKVNRSVEQALNVFDLWTGCILARNISSLEVGGTGYVTSPPFKWAARQNKLQTVIMLCTEKSLKGICITKTMVVDE